MDELSTLSPAAADTTASTARAAATALADATDHLAGLEIGGWSGTAQAGFARRADALRARTDLLATIAVAGAGIIEDYSRELGMLRLRLRSTDAELADAQNRTLDPTLTVADFHSSWAAVDRWQRGRQQVLDAYDDAADRLAQRLTAIIDHVPNRPRTLTEHLDDAADALGDSVEGGLWISLGWLDDPAGWWHDVQQVPTSVWDQATHPLDTARDTLHVDDLEDGRYGTAAGALGAAAIGKGLGRAVERATPDVVPGHERDGRGRAPGVSPQSLDEMLVGVDLARSEGVNGGHTLERHVHVDDQYLEDRLLKGTLNPRTGTYQNPLRQASRWADLPTAQDVITRGLRENAADVERMAPGSTSTIYTAAPASSGTLFVKVDGQVIERPAKRARIVVGRDDDGGYFVITAFLEGGDG